MSKYSVQARTCIKGESFFESLIADYAIPHQIVGQKDIGVDYLCEWAYEEEPSGILFTAQVKTFRVTKGNKPKGLGVIYPELNNLQAFSIQNSQLRIKQSTLDYWRGLGLPAYLFAVALTRAEGANRDEMALYYKRFTHVLTKNTNQEDEKFFRVDDSGTKFKAFENEEKRTQGFARDLFVDLMRWSYFKGNIAWMNPRKLGLQQFPAEAGAVFNDLFAEYKSQICETYSHTRKYLEQYCGCGRSS